MARVIALDLGSKRIGVASSDTTRTLASPVVVLERRGSHAHDHKAIADLVDEYEPDTMVVGLPIGLNGKEGAAAQLIRAELAELQALFEPRGVKVVVQDERFSTASAHASMMERKMNAQARRKVVDKVAAAVFLQSWLDGEKVRADMLRAEIEQLR
jgi:putative holliday junction resolvase